MRNRIFLVLDVVLAVGVALLSFTARFEGLGWWPDLASMATAYVMVAVPAKILLFLRVGLYRRLWRYASIADLEPLLVASLLATLASFIIGLVFLPAAGLTPGRVPIGILVMDSTLTAAVIALPRLLLRIAVRRARARGTPFVSRSQGADQHDDSRVLIVGAGDAGGMIVKELLENPQLGLVPVGFIDDDVKKHSHQLRGIPVLGPLAILGELVSKHAIAEVIIALPSARGKVIRDIVKASSAAGVRTRTVPGLFEILSGAKSVSALRPIQIQDLLRRDPIETDLEQVGSLVKGRVVLVTGAGGSIGSELCRQLMRLSPSRIVVVGRGENSIFELLQELRAMHSHAVITPAIADVRDIVRLRAIFMETRPYSVFHAAAHKHVPLMELSIDEAILNNVLGTRNVAELCAEQDVEHLVLISTDKAVRPTSIMGATKRIAEQTLCCVAERTGKPYVSVRFGNVLGSRGSVVPTFMKQIAAGGPITVTHPEMRRYFMTIPEAVQLVLQAAALGRGGEVFVLDMGEPVKIADLAEDMIRLSGLEVNSDVEISYTGMRPGEKLYEELFFGAENASTTSHPKILCARDRTVALELDSRIASLIDAARRCEPKDELRRMIRSLVPEYCPPAVHADGDVRRPRTSSGHVRRPIEPAPVVPNGHRLQV
jgi:Predicted nucleoside-diphosphate sugar epimerases